MTDTVKAECIPSQLKHKRWILVMQERLHYEQFCILNI